MTAKATILVVDDDPSILRLLTMRLESAGYAVQSAESGERALALASVKRPDAVITDLKMGGMDGLALHDAVQKIAPGLPVIILTAHGTIPDAVIATQRGVFGFVPKPFDGKALLDQVERALRLSAAGGAADEEWRRDIISVSAAMGEVLRQAKLAAQSDSPILIRGATGSGKELVARAIHAASSRASGPFVVINCAAIPESLLESELFGTGPASESGAAEDDAEPGAFREAENGTLFLDEVDALPLALQPNLLRALQEHAARPSGNGGAPASVRLISGTTRNMGECVAAGEFREDLYYRLNVVGLVVPALAERREDIVPLANDFLRAAAVRHGKEARAFAPEALELLVSAPWPGNVPELENVVERAVLLATTAVIPAAVAQSALAAAPATLTPLDEAKRGFERDYLVRLLKITGGNVSRAARMAHRNRTEFYKLLDRHGLEPGMFKGERA